MASGVPCVVTDSGNSAELVGDTGEVVATGDGLALGAGIVRLLQVSDAERAARGVAARERIVSKYSIDAVVRLYGSLYEEVARNVRIRRTR